MKIAIHTTELDNADVNGVRTYLSEILRHLHNLNELDSYSLYHKGSFQEIFAVPHGKNYDDVQLSAMPFWTQIAFAYAIYKDQPDVLWMPIQNVPRLISDDIKIVVTVHDLAWKYFPETFPFLLRQKLESHTSHAVKRADAIIAVSEATKKDLLYFYPFIDEKIIHVTPLAVHAPQLQEEELQKTTRELCGVFHKYLLCLGTVQPRKNLIIAIDAFEKVKEQTNSSLQLVIAGSDGWLSEKTHERASESIYADDIIFTGAISDDTKWSLLSGAEIFLMPSLYEGFGIPVLESFAAGTPAIVADNSSLREVCGDAALLCDAYDSKDLSEKIIQLRDDKDLQKSLIEKGLERARVFSWKKTTQKTLRVFTEAYSKLS